MIDIVEYQTKYGEINFPDGFLEKLVGKTIEEQMEQYRITQSSSLAKTAYGEITSEQIRNKTYKLDEYSYCRGLIVKDGILVGVMIRQYFFSEIVACLPYQSVCTYYASDNEGSGTNDRTDYAYLICL